VLRLLIVSAAVAAQPVTVLPRPPFHPPAPGTGTGRVTFQIVSSSPANPGRIVRSPSPRPLRLEGPDGATQHVVVASSRYSYDLRRYALPPRIGAGEREFVYERSPALVPNAGNFVLLNDRIISGYGFTTEPDYLYAIDRATGQVKGRVLLPSQAIRIARHGGTLTVDTYDHRLVVKIAGA
jgi:hypothetical protein